MLLRLGIDYFYVFYKSIIDFFRNASGMKIFSRIERAFFSFADEDAREPAGRAGIPRSIDFWSLPPQALRQVILCVLCG
ncbi:MAG: hypothetical protein IJH67_12520, partial [Thermoguttaceae bacterium]|nr:hypothetical protein [Thermoguttaceae bacterium]